MHDAPRIVTEQLILVGGRDIEVRVVLHEAQGRPDADLGNRERHDARESVSLKEEAIEGSEVTELCGDRTRKLVVVENEPNQLRQVPELRWDWTTELVPSEEHLRHFGKGPEFYGDRAGQLVPVQG